jgi:hypothetical protein
MRPALRCRAALALALLAAPFAVSCAERLAPQEAAPICSCAPGEPVVDPALLAFLSKARAAHHQADLAEDAKDTRRAINVLEQLTHGPRPGAPRPPPEVAEVIADTRARLADLRSRDGDIEGALRDIDEGLALATSSRSRASSSSGGSRRARRRTTAPAQSAPGRRRSTPSTRRSRSRTR